MRDSFPALTDLRGAPEPHASAAHGVERPGLALRRRNGPRETGGARGALAPHCGHRVADVRVVRHPIYTATLGFYLGTTLTFSAWWTWALLTLLLVGYVLKALDEERFLDANLAAAYKDYRRRVPYRLLPGVW